jgi:hypothetical protein
MLSFVRNYFPVEESLEMARVPKYAIDFDLVSRLILTSTNYPDLVFLALPLGLKT